MASHGAVAVPLYFLLRSLDDEGLKALGLVDGGCWQAGAAWLLE